MIDTEKYEGHTPAPWSFKGTQGLDLENETHSVVTLYDDPRLRIGGVIDMQLIADAPLLLAEVERLQKKVKKLNWVLCELDGMIMNYDSHVELMKVLEQGLELPETWKGMIE